MNIHQTITNQKEYFNTGQTLDVDHRISLLKKLRSTIISMDSDITAALQKDLGKSSFESFTTEIGLVLSELSFMIKNLKKWSKPKRVKTPLMHFPSSTKLFKEPYGTVLVISPWNYPFQLSMIPIIGALAAGNTVVLKPSELAPYTEKLITQIIKQVFDPKVVTCICGDALVAKELLEESFDYIFFTGSTQVGQSIVSQIGNRLIPMTLELGGKSPCIVDETANLKLSAKRIMWGKLINAGQTCVAPDYLVVHESIKDKLIKLLINEINKFYSNNPIINPEYPNIINKKNFERLIVLLQDQEIAYGGKSDLNTLKIEPTILDNISWENLIMKDEIFGPLLPILTYTNLEELIVNIKSKPKPLALYIFSESKKTIDSINSQLSFGSGCINDTLIQFSNPDIPFGGVGNSGMGSYHGYHSLETFSHTKGIMRKSILIDIPLRYPPFNKSAKLIKKILK